MTTTMGLYLRAIYKRFGLAVVQDNVKVSVVPIEEPEPGECGMH